SGDRSTTEYIDSVLARRFPGAEGEEERAGARKYIETLLPAAMMDELQLLLDEIPSAVSDASSSAAKSEAEQEMEDVSTWFEGEKPDDVEGSAFHGDGSFVDAFKEAGDAKGEGVEKEAGGREDERLAAESERVRGRSVIQGS
ncbi:hypothetical protein LTS18_000804, partial [Coniosporium uncinatum]